MLYKTLISTSTLFKHLNDPNWVILDCSFVLTSPESGAEDYLTAHIPGAVYVHLDHELSSPIIPGVTGRHPWPGVEQAVELFSRLGIDEGCQVVAYDDLGGALAATRAWGMLRWLGHEAVAVLDGGFTQWGMEDLPTASGEETRPRREFKVKKLRSDWVVSTEQVGRWRQDPAYRIFDARTAERYRGQNETIDPVAGHIPGAVSAPYGMNLRPDNTFRPKSELRAHYQALLGEIPAENTASYCGSGATSILNILAMLHAGLGEGKLYAGSWSEWIAPRTRPVATTER